jgi:16S rRNA (adenine1518-N6/adenine1519-N6)-dimethyltransferase
MGHNFKKQFGQNFMRNDRFAHELIKDIPQDPDTVVVEIGPGDGRVTNLLLAGGRKVLAIEIDYSLIVQLIKRFGDNPSFQLINQDVLQVDIVAELTNLGWDAQNYFIVGALPYNIGKQIIAKSLELTPAPVSMHFVLQEEVAQDYVAQPPKASFLSSWIRLFADVSKGVSIPKSQFYPMPKVNGGILRIKPHPSHPLAATITKLLRVGFSSPRKTLWNNLRSLPEFNSMQASEFLQEFKLTEHTRAAEIDLNVWEALANYAINSTQSQN